MAQVDGSQLVAEGLKEEGVDTIFYIMGGPNILLSMHAERLGIRLIDVRHEQAAAPDRTVVVLHGDGSLGLNLMELDTAVRNKLPVLVVVSNNAGWTARPGNNMHVPGRELGHVRYDIVAQGLGAYGELVEDPRAVRPALERAMKELEKGKPALLNVITEPTARAQTVPFASYGGESAGTSLM